MGFGWGKLGSRRTPTMIPLLLGLAYIASAPESIREAVDRPRLVVLTDISSLSAGVAEPDDGQSLIRLMLYTNDFDIEGLVATSNLGHGRRVRPDLIRRVVDTYGKVRPNLLLHDDRYPPASELAGVIKAGRPAFQADFQARLDRCNKPYAEANHAPVVRIRGERERAVAPGEVITLDASGTTDPDGDGLNFE